MADEQDTPVATGVTGTCITDGCANAGIPIFIAVLYGELWCGVCSHQITGIEESDQAPRR